MIIVERSYFLSLNIFLLSYVSGLLRVNFRVLENQAQIKCLFRREKKELSASAAGVVSGLSTPATIEKGLEPGINALSQKLVV